MKRGLHLQKARFIYVFFFVFIFINGCSEQKARESAISCTLDEQKCVINYSEGETLVDFARAPVTEELLSVKIVLPADQKFIDGYVEGVNMEMGKSPFMTNAVSDRLVEGEIFLGSCTERHMQWQLVIRSRNKKDAIVTQRIFFSTMQSN
jgi:hypothetical protein